MFKEQELKCFCIGLGVGAAAGLLFSPTSGVVTRKMIQSKATEGTDYIRNQATIAAHAAADAVDRGNRTIRQRKENVLAAVEAGKAAYSEASAATPSM